MVPCTNATMGRARRPLVPPPLRSLRVARQLTSAFHRVTRLLDSARRQGESTAELETELEALGGREAYQAASVLTTQRHRTSKYVFSRLTAHGFGPRQVGREPLPLLEVGAVNLDLSSVPRWLATRAIDLRSTHPRIEQRDFFTLRPRGNYAVVVLSMVLNCVEDPSQRGAMLLGCRAHLQPHGLFFLMLPLRCLTHSPYMTEEHLTRVLAAAGFELMELKRSTKVVFLLSRAVTTLADHRQLGPPALRIVEGDNLTNDFSVTFTD